MSTTDIVTLAIGIICGCIGSLPTAALVFRATRPRRPRPMATPPAPAVHITNVFQPPATPPVYQPGNVLTLDDGPDNPRIIDGRRLLLSRD